MAVTIHPDGKSRRWVVCALPGVVVASFWPWPRKARAQNTTPDASQGIGISQVSVSTTAFAPSQKETAQVRYTLSRDAAITVKIFDPDRELVRILVLKTARRAGAHSEPWDGRDMDGVIVPNEAYFFTFEAEAPGFPKAVYDPVTFSGGEYGDIVRGEVSKEIGEITYKLSQPSRVRLRAGVQGSAMARTVVDWEPRVGGTITERWSGMDEDNVVSVWERGKFIMILSYITLPDTSVITLGNNRLSYRDYKAGLKTPRPKKEDRPMANNRKISPHFFRSRLTDRAFHIRLTFPELEKGGPVVVPEVKGTVLIHVDVTPEDRQIVLNQQYEMMLFNDFIFHAEEESGYLPFNFPWEVGQLPEGEHILTVNISTHTDQVGVGKPKDTGNEVITRLWRYCKAPGVVFILIAGLGGCARTANQVVVYTSVDQPFAEPVLKDFERQTGISVLPVYDVEAAKTTGLVNRLIAEKDRPQADVFWSSDTVRTIALKRRGVLAAYRSPTAEAIPAAYRDPEGYWTGFGARARVLLVNTSVVKDSDLPKSILELTEPKWRGKVAMSFPLFGTMSAHVAAIFLLLGDDKARNTSKSLRPMA